MLTLSNLKLRIISSLILVPVVIGLIYAGGWLFGILVSLMFALCCGEWFEMSRKFHPRVIYLAAGFIYFAASFSMFTNMRIDHPDGFMIILTLMLCVWASDTGAYIVGRMVGGPKLAPKISPNKTWSGFCGAMFGAAVVFTFMFQQQAPMVLLLVYGAVIGAAGQAGDLLESHMKRKANIKDSGTLIPGHGGILDRIDALLLVIPVFAIIIMYGL